MSDKHEQPIIEQLVETIGADATLALVKRHGGKLKWIPAKPTGWMLEALKREDAIKICAKFQSNVVQIPKATAWKRARRNRQIIEAYEAHLRGEPPPVGMSVHELVEAFDLTEWSVREILKRPTPEAPPEPKSDPPPTFGGVAHRRDPATLDLFR